MKKSIFSIFMLAGIFTAAFAQSTEPEQHIKRAPAGTNVTQAHVVPASTQTAKHVTFNDSKTDKKALPAPTGNQQNAHAMMRPAGKPETK